MSDTDCQPAQILGEQGVNQRKVSMSTSLGGYPLSEPKPGSYHGQGGGRGRGSSFFVLGISPYRALAKISYGGNKLWKDISYGKWILPVSGKSEGWQK